MPVPRIAFQQDLFGGKEILVCDGYVEEEDVTKVVIIFPENRSAENGCKNQSTSEQQLSLF
jgi:hypothetical protein